MYPDIVVFKRERPWVFIELKESRRLTTETAEQERKKLFTARQKFPLRRGYLIYVARYRSGKVLPPMQGVGSRFVCEVPILMQDKWNIEDIAKWEKEYRLWSKPMARAVAQT